MREISNMSGVEFEVYLQAILKKMGYRVKLTKTTGDFGADLILMKDNEKIVVQAKRYKGNVGIKAVQEVLGAKSYYGATKAWVITNSYYTKAATELAAKSDVTLIDQKGLVQLAETLNIYIEAHAVSKNETASTKRINCPICHSEMIMRKSKYGAFYGCSRYPQCKGKRKL